MGKTTILRDAIRKISDGIDSIGFKGKTCGIVDERGEIAAIYQGIPQNDVGLRTDVIENISKEKGMRMLIRSMAPEIIACDEIGSKEDVKAIVENASEIHRPVFLAGVEGGGANGCDKDLADYFAIAKSKVNVLDNFDFEKLMDKKVYQMMVGCYKEEYADILRDVDGARITAWWTRAADITPANGNKGVGVRKILDYYHLDKENAIAFGDGTNDIEMLEAVGTGVAMGNATDDVKAVADAICGHVAEDGIYHYCKEQGLI